MKFTLKSGVTPLSLGIYIVIFATFTIFTSVIITGLNDNLFDKRGEAINYSNLNKLQNNIENSSLSSEDVTIDTIYGTIEFSNGDVYKYDNNQKILLKNNGVLCMSVQDFNFSMVETDNGKKISIHVIFNKYLNVLDRNIVTFVGVN